MIVRKFEAIPALRDYIKCYWYYRIQPAQVKHFDVLPDGHFDLVVTVKESQVVETRLTGIWTKPVSISYEEDTEVFGISFNPIAIGGLLSFNIAPLLNDSELTTLSRFHIREQAFIDCFHEPLSLVSYLNQRLLELQSPQGPDERLKKCFDLINQSDGRTSVKEISAEIGLGSRQLHKLITGMIGIGVKEYSKITRFKKSLLEIKKSDCNYYHYYDQSHFIREVKQYAGKTPKQMDLRNDDRFIQYYYFS